jgi:hypothetical protein
MIHIGTDERASAYGAKQRAVHHAPEELPPVRHNPRPL